MWRKEIDGKYILYITPYLFQLFTQVVYKSNQTNLQDTFLQNSSRFLHGDGSTYWSSLPDGLYSALLSFSWHLLSGRVADPWDQSDPVYPVIIKS